MNFDNIVHYDLMTWLYRFFPFPLILLFWHWPYSPQCVKEFKIHSVETASEVSQKSNVKIVTYVKGNTWSEVKRIKKSSKTSPAVQFKEFSLTKQKTRPRSDYEWVGKTISKKIRWKNLKKPQKINVKMPHVNKKPQARNRNLVQTKN